MKALLTGGTGYLGGLLRGRLQEAGIPCREIPGRQGADPPIRALAELRRHLEQALEEPAVDTIFHLAGSGQANLSEQEHLWANLETSRILAEAIRQSRFAGSVVYSSSAAVYGNTGLEPVSEETAPNPCSLLGQTKLQAEQLLSESLAGRCRLRVARVFNLFGRGHAKMVVYLLARNVVISLREWQVDVILAPSEPARERDHSLETPYVWCRLLLPPRPHRLAGVSIANAMRSLALSGEFLSTTLRRLSGSTTAGSLTHTGR